jgi:pyridinium-3,5-bisthiocarboxylic acid mononucleotide nickel chelatase
VRALIFDPFAGISGDMTIAALLDIGLEEAWLRGFVQRLGLASVNVTIERVRRRGIAAPHVHFTYPSEHSHRHLRHVLEIIDRCVAPDTVKTRACDAFRRIAEAEARVHGTTVEQVHFHEVGAVDAILDVMTVMAGVTQLRYEAFFTRPVAVGSGWIDMDHGRYPVPAPATLAILHGFTLTGTELAGECTTPTGAAILATLTGGRSAPGELLAGRVGYGAGTRDPEDRPNVLRLFEAELAAPDAVALWLIQADIDDMTPEFAAAALDALLQAGAADAVLIPLTMKKSRPGVRIEILASSTRLADVERTLFLTTTTIGLRRWPVQRTVLERNVCVREWRGQQIRFKRVRLPDGTFREKPEYEDVVRAAETLGMTPFQARRLLAHESSSSDL